MSMTETQPQQISRVDRINDSIDKQAVGSTAISRSSGGILFENMVEVMEFAKLMSVSDVAVPKHLRGNPGACLAVAIQAVEWKMSPYAVANKSYVVNDRISYESQLIHAVVEQRAPLAGRLRCSYSGQGDQRRCKVWAMVKGEAEAFEYESAAFGMIQPKNSPLWKTKPDLQLFYNASRDWARMYFPDVILGVYAEDEIDAPPAVVRQAVAMPRAIGHSLPETQLSEEDALKVLRERSRSADQNVNAETGEIIESGSSDSPSSAHEQEDARGGGEGEQQQSREPDPFDVRKTELFDILIGNKHTAETAQRAWEKFLIRHKGCGGKNGDERKLPAEAWPVAFKAAQDNAGDFTSPN